jgi:hypothetical protein
MANQTLRRRSVRWPPPNLPAACTSQVGTTLFRSAQHSARRWKIPREAMCKRSRPMAPAQPPACWATCFGQRNALPQETSVPRHLIPAREEWAQALGPTISLCRCRRCDSNRAIRSPIFCASRQCYNESELSAVITPFLHSGLLLSSGRGSAW